AVNEFVNPMNSVYCHYKTMEYAGFMRFTNSFTALIRKQR
ncbi:9505_t:CDS:1, partial [Ambispora leptoticha]